MSQMMARQSTAPTPPISVVAPPVQRLASVDIYRGMVMFLMMAEVLNLRNLKKAFPNASWAQWISFHTDHVEWRGCSLHDMIQPSFSFLVGTAMALSLVSRSQRGQSWLAMLGHAVLRSFILIFLGIFLRSLTNTTTNYRFDDTLTQIGLGYWILFLLSSLSIRALVVAILVILAGYWGAFVLYPAPPADFAYASVGVPSDWPEHYTGIASHFNKNSNLAWYVDTWWMNLFPRENEKPFEFFDGGYATLSFIPTLATMLLGLVAGKLLQLPLPILHRIGWFVLAAVLCMASAWGGDALGWCPIVKRIWTPTWVLWSGGICFLWLAVLHGVSDGGGYKAWAFPFMVIGANSIVAYVMSGTMERQIDAALHRHFETVIEWITNLLSQWFKFDAHPFVIGICTLLIMWCILFWLYRRRIFVRI